MITFQCSVSLSLFLFGGSFNWITSIALQTFSLGAHVWLVATEFTVLVRAKCLHSCGSISCCFLWVSHQLVKRGGQQSTLRSMWRGGIIKLPGYWKILKPTSELPRFMWKVQGVVCLCIYKAGREGKSTMSVFWHAGVVCSCISTALVDRWAAWKKQAPACRSSCSLHAGQGPCLEQKLSCCGKRCFTLALQCASWSRIHV